VAGMSVSGPGISAVERDTLQRRTLVTLGISQVLGSAGLTSGITVGGLLAKEMLGGDTFAGLATASLTIGSAIGAAKLAQLMVRRGRRPGLVVGYVIGSAGAVLAIASAELRWFWLLVAGSILLGAGQASNLLARYAAADLARPERRGEAISTLVFMSTFGAVAGPVLVGVGGRLGTSLGIDELAGPFLFSIVFFLVAALNTGARLRPDPLVVAGGVHPERAGRNRVDVAGSLRVVSAFADARLALGAMIVSQSVMVAVMTMTPLHMRDHDHSVQLVGFVLAVHIAGMYGLAPVFGRLTDRRGGRPMIAVGGIVLVVATVVASLAGAAPVLLFAGLFLLGVGWSIGLVAGSALLSGAVPLEHRAKVQGTADLCMSLCGGLAGFASCFVKHAFGYHMLANLGLVAAALLVVYAWYGRLSAPVQRPAP
jgi:MFS family permease